ncbi:hypothetical protein VQL36_11615 [Chengkuizengella sp. SCS-71B]|uniref:phage lytic cycle repressor MrpR family protein n=1 Tax=Chengkuizengella sp. SCS-71B TaxID=3115290 RepID=UPI0032C230C1
MKIYRKELENVTISILNDIKNNQQMINKLKNRMITHGMLSGEVIRIISNPEKIKDLSIGMLYLFIIQLHSVTEDELIHPNMLGLYNCEIKSKFLTKLSDKSQYIYLRVFEISAEVEVARDTDLFDLGLDDIEIILYSLRPLTTDASHVNGRIVTSYINWSLQHGYSKGNKNELSEKKVKWFDQFVYDKNLQLYFNDSTIRKIEDDCLNYQDMVIVRLLFEGVQGKSLSEIRNIQKGNMDFNTNTVQLKDENGNERTVKLSDRAISIIERAFQQETYIKKNGQMEEDDHMSDKTKLVENDYLIRSSLTKTTSYEKEVEKMVVYRRIQTIAKTLGIECLTAKNIVRSGMIYEGKLILEKKGILEKEDYQKICDKFAMPKQNWYPLKKFINEKTIAELYN